MNWDHCIIRDAEVQAFMLQMHYRFSQTANTLTSENPGHENKGSWEICRVSLYISDRCESKIQEI